MKRLLWADQREILQVKRMDFGTPLDLPFVVQRL